MSTTKLIIVNLLLFLFIINSICEIDICDNKSDGFYSNFNCHSFYFCLNKTLNKTFQCPNPSEPIFSSYRQRCVANNSLYDECYLTNIIENSENCAWFSIQLSTNPNITFHYSCFYPFLFDLQTKECKQYFQVQCNQRFEPKDTCKKLYQREQKPYFLYLGDYHHPQIRNSIDERPCWLTPSCRNKLNGFHGNQLQECSSYYECKNERFISSTICPRRMRFSDKYKACLPKLTNCENTTIY